MLEVKSNSQSLNHECEPLILTKRAIKKDLKEIYSIVQKDTKQNQNKPMETTKYPENHVLP